MHAHRLQFQLAFMCVMRINLCFVYSGDLGWNNFNKASVHAFCTYNAMLMMEPGKCNDLALLAEMLSTFVPLLETDLRRMERM